MTHVYRNPENDLDMDRAIARAQQSFRYFWRELAWEQRRIIPALDLACVKVPFSDPSGSRPASPDAPEVEQMWLSEIDFDGAEISGTLINSPNWLTSVKEGDQVRIPLEKISDWMYAVQGRAYGGFTVNLMRSRMSPRERKQHDDAWGLDFGDPHDVQLMPADWSGSQRKGFFNRVFGNKQVTPTVDLEAEHPMAVNMAESLDQFLKEDPSNVHSANHNGLTFLHQLALAGSAIGVSILLKHGANPNAVTKAGATPLQLAQSLGWSKVVALLSDAGPAPKGPASRGNAD